MFKVKGHIHAFISAKLTGNCGKLITYTSFSVRKINLPFKSIFDILTEITFRNKVNQFVKLFIIFTFSYITFFG